MILKILRPGIFTTFQDKGRFNVQYMGISPGGCMDYGLFILNNKLLNNDENTGLIEFAYQGPELLLEDGRIKFAITGDVYFKIKSKTKEEIIGVPNRTYELNKGEIIDILATKNSVYGYLGFEGGIKLESFYSSISSQVRSGIGPNNGKKIEKDYKISLKQESSTTTNTILDNFKLEKKSIFNVIEGPQINYFSENSKKEFFSKSFKVTNQTDRMGMRLVGSPLENIKSSNISSEAIIKGAIQVPGDGNPIILLNDHQTTGGYPKIASVISSDLYYLVQTIPSKDIFFKKISVDEAENLFHLYLDAINALSKKIKKID